MRELNVCLKLNFLSRKLPILIGIIFLSILYIQSRKNNIYMSMDSIHVLESLFLIIYASYNYRNSFIYWRSIGGKRKDFYLSSFILYIFTAAVAAYIQTLIFINYISKIKVLMDDYGKLQLIQVANFTPLELWIYLFFSFMCCICAGSFLGALNIKYDFGKSFAISIVYFLGSAIIYMLLSWLFQGNIPSVFMTQISVYLYQIVIYIISAYLGWRVINKEDDLCIE